MKYFFFLLFLPFSLQAQSGKEAIHSLLQTYQNLNAIDSKMRISVYEKVSDTQAESEYFTLFKKQGKQFWMEYEGITSLRNEHIFLTLDRQAKTMAYLKNPQQLDRKMAKMEDNWKTLDSMLSQVDSLGFERKNGRDVIQLFSPNSDLYYAELVLDAETHLLKEMSYHYKSGVYDQEKVKTEYLYFNIKPQFDANTFSEKPYFISATSKPTAEYKYFHLMEIPVMRE